MKTKLSVLLFMIALSGLVIIYETRLKPDHKKTDPIKRPDAYSAINSQSIASLQIKTLDGKSLTLNEMDESILLLNFWASWCPPCLKEFPDMVDLIKQYQGKIALIAVSIDQDKKDMQSVIAKQKKIDIYPDQHIYWAWDPDRSLSLQKFNTRNIPETYLINKQRQIVGKIIGATNWKSKEIKNKLNYIQ